MGFGWSFILISVEEMHTFFPSCVESPVGVIKLDRVLLLTECLIDTDTQAQCTMQYCLSHTHCSCNYATLHIFRLSVISQCIHIYSPDCSLIASVTLIVATTNMFLSMCNE